MAYPFSSIESKWQSLWLTHDDFRSEENSIKPKYYVLDMFPYPSSAGLHVGHVEGYTASDILARYKRACGFNVLHPMGWDAFGLPAEQYALKTGVHPEITTRTAIDNFRSQLRRLGLSYDWSREFATCDSSYYRWTQFLFKRIYEKGLAYQKEVPVNWCPELKTVLANEEVVDGKSERGGHPVFRVPMKQWMLKITDYAERLLKDLDALDWPESTKELQRNWIGRSEGAIVQFPLVKNDNEFISVYTTRVDTIYGVSALVLAPEHPALGALVEPQQKVAVETYQVESQKKSDLDRQDPVKAKTGVFTGAYVKNPFNGESVPVWIADYVLMGYGTGAVMSVPAHDQRDEAFAKNYQLASKKVIQADDPYGEGILEHSGLYSGLTSAVARERMTQWLVSQKLGSFKVQYKLRDWLFSRQRYWGEPFPILRDSQGRLHLVEDDELPVTLPQVSSYEPSGTGESPLAALMDWVKVQGRDGEPHHRETDTMPGSAASSWYFLRFCDPHNEKEPWSKEAQRYWMPVDLYLGGSEHAVGHLLYSRFWTKVFYDLGLVDTQEPFKRLVHQGMILGEDGEKMSKSRGNVVNPDEVIGEYGADSLRLYEMFMGPLDKEKPWSSRGIEGVHRFLNRVWRLFYQEDDSLCVDTSISESSQLSGLGEEFSKKYLRETHKLIRNVTQAYDKLQFNTALSFMMSFVNELTKDQLHPRWCLDILIKLLHPMAPHICEELWQALGHSQRLSFVSWPSYDESLCQEDLISVAIQVMGKTRGSVQVPPGSSLEIVEKAVSNDAGIYRFIEGKEIKKKIFVQNRILNFIL